MQQLIEIVMVVGSFLSAQHTYVPYISYYGGIWEVSLFARFQRSALVPQHRTMEFFIFSKPKMLSTSTVTSSSRVQYSSKNVCVQGIRTYYKYPISTLVHFRIMTDAVCVILMI